MLYTVTNNFPRRHFVSESAAKTPNSSKSDSSKARKKTKARKARKKSGGKAVSARKKARKKTVRKKKATTKKATKKKATKKTVRKKKATRKKATKSARGGRRAPQGRRLGGWEIVKRDDVFGYLEKTGTTIATLARTLDVGSSAVHAWKAGRRFPSEQAQLKLQQMLAGDLSLATTVKKSKRSGGKARAFSGKNFRKVREERGLSRAKLSKQLGVSAGSIRNWEAGVSKPRGANLDKVQEFLAETPQPSVGSAPAAGSPQLGAGGDSAVLGAAQVASAYLAAGHPMRPDGVVSFVTALRAALS